jgi:hypothetical protein
MVLVAAAGPVMNIVLALMSRIGTRETRTPSQLFLDRITRS